MLALKVFSENNDTTTSNFLQAINYAVANGAKVINESFGSNNFPDLAADVIRQADDAAVAAGVTVVASSGDAGITSTIGSPGTDPNVISVGASTTFRAYEQVTLGGVNVPGTNGKFVDNNISSLSSGGFSESGNTVDLVAPGDSNWALCSTNSTLYTDCTNFDGTGSSPIEFTGGTSESSPLVAGAAADVIQAYAGAHGGADPSPAQVKQILMSSATDINAPATQQGAGLLNIAAAVKLAKSSGTSQRRRPHQPWPVQHPAEAGRDVEPDSISVTNTSSPRSPSSCRPGHSPSRSPTRPARSACSRARRPQSCPANTGVLDDLERRHRGVPEGALHSACDGASVAAELLLRLPVHRPDVAHARGADRAGRHLRGLLEPRRGSPTSTTSRSRTRLRARGRRVFFTVKNSGKRDIGTSGPIQWDANVSQFAPAGSVSPHLAHAGRGRDWNGHAQGDQPEHGRGHGASRVVVSSGCYPHHDSDHGPHDGADHIVRRQLPRRADRR